MDVQSLDEKMVTFESEGITLHMFQYQITKRAKSQRKHIVLPEGNDDRILQATARLQKQAIVDLTILCDAAQITTTLKRLGITLDISQIQMIDPATSDHFDEYAETIFALRKGKIISLETARDLMADVSYFGTMMVYKGHADGMVSGAVHTTQHTIRPALQFVKTKPGISVVSSVFFMCLPDRVTVFGDCAYQLFKMPHEKPICVGLVERIGLENSVITHKRFIDSEEKVIQLTLDLTDHGAGLHQVAQLLTDK